MKNAIKKETFLKAVAFKPALVKKLTSFNEDLIVEAVRKNNKCIDYLEPAQKTARVYGAFLRCNRYADPSKIPANIWKDIPKSDLKALLKHSPDVIEDMPHATYEMWLESIKHGYRDNLDDVPDTFITPELMEIAWNKNGSIHIKEKFWTQELAEKAVKQAPIIINRIPKHLITAEMLRLGLKTGLNLGYEVWDIPVWTEELADQAVQSHGWNIKILPQKFVTKERILVAIENWTLNFDEIQEQFHDDWDIQVKAVACCNAHNLSTPRLSDPKFHAAVLKISAGITDSHSVPTFRAAKYLRDVNWNMIVEEIPLAIACVAKTDQTDQMINAFLQSVDIKIIDEYVRQEKINLSKLKKEHAPFLIGTENSNLQSLLERKLNPPKKETVKTIKIKGDTVEIEMSPKEFNNLIREYD